MVNTLRNPHLVGVAEQVVEGDETCDELAVEKVVRLVDGAQAPVRVVVRVRAEAERPVCNAKSAESAKVKVLSQMRVNLLSQPRWV